MKKDACLRRQVLVLCFLLQLAAVATRGQEPAPCETQAFSPEPSLEIWSQAPGYLFFVGEPVRLTAAMRTPPAAANQQVTCEVRLLLPANSGTATVRGPCWLSKTNDYRTQIELPIEAPGYYEIRWTLNGDRGPRRPVAQTWV